MAGLKGWFLWASSGRGRTGTHGSTTHREHFWRTLIVYGMKPRCLNWHRTWEPHRSHMNPLRHVIETETARSRA